MIGLCHSVQHTSRQIANWLKVPYEKLHFFAAGVNHQAFMLKLEADGRDLYPELKKCLDIPEIYKRDKVRFELLRHFDYFPTESSGHGSEYIPYIRKRQDLNRQVLQQRLPEDRGRARLEHDEFRRHRGVGGPLQGASGPQRKRPQGIPCGTKELDLKRVPNTACR